MTSYLRGQLRYRSSKTYGHELGFSCAFRQWKAESHCNRLHGYTLKFHFVFQADEVDYRNWVIDFGGLKSLKQYLEHMFDHTTLVARDDPHYKVLQHLSSLGIIDLRTVEATGCEAIAKLVYDHTEEWLQEQGASHRVDLEEVQVHEHGANSASYGHYTGGPTQEV